MKRKDKAVITAHESLSPGIFSMRIKTSLAAEAYPGQFIGVYPKDGSRILMRPISICDASGEEIRLVYRTAGVGTTEISGFIAGEEVDILGILGNGYDISALKGKKVILMGGGIGIPPMLYLAKRCAGEGIEVKAVLGYADDKCFLRDEFEAVCPTYIASMDGSAGTKGTVIDATEKEGLDGDVICACGPMPMLKALKGYADAHGMKAYISLEERMACGVGACLGCVTKTVKKDPHTNVNNTRICVEGPVFDASEVDL